jgi:trimethylamine--corrinoid protein Co-methyltransferase
VSIIFDRLQTLTRENIEFIHNKTIEILGRTGMWFQSEETRNIFKRHGFAVKGEIVYFTEEAINQGLKTIPEKFLLIARNPKQSKEVSLNSYILGPSGGSPFILDYKGNLHRGTSKDCQDSIKIGQALDVIDFNRGLVTSDGDIHPANVPLYQLLTAMKLTDKPLDCPTVDGIGLLSILFGISKKEMQESARKGIAYALSYINPISPLGLSAHESDRLTELCKFGVALAISPMPMAGTTAPCTLPGLLVSQNCEILSCLVLTQLINPGCPVMYGCIGTITDMKYVNGAIGAPESRLIEYASAQIAKFYGIPARGDVGLTDANDINFQAGAESAFHFVNAVRCGINLLPGLGAMGSWNIGSLEKLVLDAEIGGYVKRLITPLVFNEDTIGTELINKVGPRGSFISEEHTFNNFRHEFYQPQVFSRKPYENWIKEGKELIAEAHGKVEDILNNFSPPDLERSLEKELEEYADAHYPVS